MEHTTWDGGTNIQFFGLCVGVRMWETHRYRDGDITAVLMTL